MAGNGKLAEIIAIQKDVTRKFEDVSSTAYRVAPKAPMFNGFTKTYTTREEGGDSLPAEATNVQVTVAGLIESLRAPMVRMVDVLATKDMTNRTSSAVLTDEAGNELFGGKEIPGVTLLMLEKYLLEMRAFVAALPVLDPSTTWDLDANTGLYVAPQTQTTRSRKVTQPLVLYPHTEKHPAQVKEMTVDIIAGDWTQRRFSGAIPLVARTALVDRIESLLRSVKKALTKANEEPIVDNKIGDEFFTLIFGQ